MRHITFEKGDKGVVKVMDDLIEKGYVVFLPFSEQLHFDIVAYCELDKKFLRIQCKYKDSGDRGVPDKCNQKKSVKYSDDAFDYYGIYFADIKRVIYPSITFGGKIIRTTIPNSAIPYYWFEDFIKFTDKAEKRVNLNVDYSNYSKSDELRRKARKVKWPSMENLEELIKKEPLIKIAESFNVTDNTIRKWCKYYEINPKELSPFTRKRASRL